MTPKHVSTTVQMTTYPDAIQAALLEWANEADPDAQCVLLMDTAEIITLHYMLALCQWLVETSSATGHDLRDLGTLRKKVEGILVQAGYGGDPRP